MRRRGLGALHMTPGLDHDHGLGSGRRTGGRHELPGVFDGFDIEQDRARGAIQRKEIQQVAEIDIELIADRDHRREADRSLCRPLGQSGDDRAGLGEEGQIALARHPRREARIEVRRRCHDAEAVRPDNAHAIFPRCTFRPLGKRSSSVAQPGREDNGGGDAPVGRGGDDLRHRFRGRGDHRDIGCRVNRVDARDCRKTLNFSMMRIDDPELPRKTPGAQIADYRAANRAFAQACTDHRDGARKEQLLQPIGRHEVSRVTRRDIEDKAQVTMS
jgi:hypothetical protein